MKNRHSIIVKTAWLICTLLALGGFSLPANAGMVVGNSARDYAGSNQTTQVAYSLGSHINGYFSWFKTAYYVTTANYLANFTLYECSTGVYDKTTCRSYLFTDDNTCNYGTDFDVRPYQNTHNGITLVAYQPSYYWDSAGAGSCHTMPATGIPFDPNKWYWLTNISRTTHHGSTNSGNYAPVGALPPAFHDWDGTSLIIYLGASYTVDTSLGTGYYQIFDSEGEVGLNPQGLISSGALANPIDLSKIATTSLSCTGISQLTGAGGFCANVFGSPSWGNYMYDGCAITTFLVVPGCDAWTAIGEAGVRLEKTAPFSYGYQIWTAFGQINASSGSFPSVVLKQKWGPVSASYELFSINTVEHYMPTNFMQTLRTLMALSVWFALGFYVWTRVTRLVSRI